MGRDNARARQGANGVGSDGVRWGWVGRDMRIVYQREVLIIVLDLSDIYSSRLLTTASTTLTARETTPPQSERESQTDLSQLQLV